MLGHYNPRTEPVEFAVDAEKAKEWLAKGAQPTATVERLLRGRRRPAGREVGKGRAMAAPELVEYVAKSLVDRSRRRSR